MSESEHQDEGSDDATYGPIRLNFVDEGYALDVFCADEAINKLYGVAALHFVTPIRVLAEMGKLSQDRAERALAGCYARGGVVLGSPTPGLEDFSEEDWERWLLDDRDRFRSIRSFCEVRSNFQRDEGTADADSRSGEEAERDLSAVDSIRRSGRESSRRRDR